MATADPAPYAVFNITADGTILSEAAELTLSRSANSTANTTIAKGYAGETMGAPTATFSVTNMVPSADFELDAGNYMLVGRVVEIGIVHPSGKQAIFKATIIEDTTSYGVNGAASYAFNGRGGFPKFE